MTVCRFVIFGLIALAMRAETGICGGLAAKVAPYNGRNVIWVDGQPMPPLMYSGTEHSRDTWAGRPRRSLEDFTALGYQIIQTDLWFKYSLQPDGSFDWPGIRKQLAGILAVNSNAMLVVRINVSAPVWWRKQNTNELCQVTLRNPEREAFGGNSAESLASEAYAAFARENLRRFLTGLAQTPEGDRVIGIHIGGGVYGEWHYYGIYQEPDASEPMRKAFCAFARQRYGSLDRINAAWQTAFRSEAELTVPSYERRYATGDGDFRDPQKDRYVIDYYACQQAVVSSLVNSLAKVTKETWPRPVVVGVFYGYFYGGWTVGEQGSQADVKTLFRSPYVDYFSGPYALRDMYGAGVPRTLTDSVRLNGKLWMTEHDGGTHLGNISDSAFPTIPKDEAQSVARMRRNSMYVLTDAVGQWWYDFGPDNRSGWWSTPRLLKEAKDLLTLYQARMRQPYVKPSDVLVVYDMDSFSYTRPMKADALTRRLTEGMTAALLETGAAFDRIFLMDLDKVNLSAYKLVIFGNTFALSAVQRQFIRTRVMTPGRRVVFLSGAGYTDGVTGGTERISDLVGMRVERLEKREPSLAISLGGTKATVNTAGLTTLFCLDDARAKPVGVYPSGRIGAGVREMQGARVYYFGFPVAENEDVLNALLREAGIRTYIDGTVKNDAVSVGGGMLAIYSVSGGARKLKPIQAAPRIVRMTPFSCRYFDLSTGDELTE